MASIFNWQLEVVLAPSCCRWPQAARAGSCYSPTRLAYAFSPAVPLTPHPLPFSPSITLSVSLPFSPTPPGKEEEGGEEKEEKTLSSATRVTGRRGRRPAPPSLLLPSICLCLSLSLCLSVSLCLSLCLFLSLSLPLSLSLFPSESDTYQPEIHEVVFRCYQYLHPSRATCRQQRQLYDEEAGVR
jgi:hypothetical protein